MHSRLKQIAREFFGDIDIMDITDEQLVETFKRIQLQKNAILLKESFNSYFSNPEYTRLVLAEGMIRMLLREIAPKRRNKRKKGR